MEDVRTLQTHSSGLSPSITRRGMINWTVRLSGGAVLAMLPALHGVQHVAAQDDDDVVTLTGTASEVSARPGTATARAAASEAVAERGAARVQAAAALSSADSEEGAVAQSAVAVAAADPDQGAIAQSANAVASAASEDEESSPVSGGASGRRVRGRRIRARRGRRARRVRVDKLPSTGAGLSSPGMLSALLAGVAALAAGGAVTLRDREEPREVTTAPVGS